MEKVKKSKLAYQMNDPLKNTDLRTIDGFGQEWRRYDQSDLMGGEGDCIFDDYFHLVPWSKLEADAVGVDLGCGSGRWARVVSHLVRTLHVVDASPAALEVAKDNLKDLNNIKIHWASVSELPFQSLSADFVYSLGVLHHVPDIETALDEINRILKVNGLFLVYLYYALENRGSVFRTFWRLSNVIRRAVCLLPFRARALVTDIIATTVYWPLSRTALLLEKIGMLPRDWPLSYQRNKSFYTMRTDCLDRFGTHLERRFTKGEILRLLSDHGFKDIKFSEREPYWCAIARKTDCVA